MTFTNPSLLIYSFESSRIFLRPSASQWIVKKTTGFGYTLQKTFDKQKYSITPSGCLHTRPPLQAVFIED
jgi:hypothetical protein